MKRRSFLKIIGAGAAAISAGAALTIEKTKEVYSHWNQPFKGEDRRKYFKREGQWCGFTNGPQSKLCATDPPKVNTHEMDLQKEHNDYLNSL